MGSFDSVCWVSGLPISRDERVAVLVVEQRVKDVYHDRDSDALYIPRGVFGRGVYDEYGWIVPDEDQPEFEDLLKELLDISPDAESWQVYDAAKALREQKYKTLGREKEWGEIKLCFVREEVLDRAIQQCSNMEEVEALRLQLEQVELDLDSSATNQLSSEEVYDLCEKSRETYEGLCKALLRLDFPTLAVNDLLIDHDRRRTRPRRGTESLLRKPSWVRKIAEVGAFYAYHKWYLWRPVCHTGFGLTPSHLYFRSYAPFVQERLWLAQQAQVIFAQQQEDREDAYISCTLKVDGRIEFTVNAYDWIALSNSPLGGEDDQHDVNDLIRRIVANPSDPELLKEFLMSSYGMQSQDWLFAQEYVKRFNAPVTGEFNVQELGNYIYFYRSNLAKELGITYSR